mgnify:CR=1 FL=1
MATITCSTQAELSTAYAQARAIAKLTSSRLRCQRHCRSGAAMPRSTSFVVVIRGDAGSRDRFMRRYSCLIGGRS